VAGIDEELGQWLAAGPPLHAMRERLAQAGAGSLAADALEKAGKGITSVQEAMNFCGPAVDRRVAK
jgi:type II secretory ATPase GspE/PulE/Tfp pilus assembly ATPase PilB-like protein